MITGILICHGQLAFEMINAANKIFGNAQQLYPFSNDFLSPKVLFEQVQQVVEQHRSQGVIIMVDMRGGSCWAAAKMLSKDSPGVHVISGVNIPMLISFLSKRERVSVQELPEVLEADGHRGICLD